MPDHKIVNGLDLNVLIHIKCNASILCVLRRRCLVCLSACLFVAFKKYDSDVIDDRH